MDADLKSTAASSDFAAPETTRIVDESVRHRLAIIVWAIATIFFTLTTATSWLRWANFEYRTFDLAYYVQGLWQLIHGRFEVTVEHVPLLGNHVEPIVFLFAPVFAVIRHPMVFVIVQNAALALMAPIGYRFARIYFEPKTAALLAVSLVLTPAVGYIALHEFHPEALTAPLLLMMIYAREARRLLLHWVCFVGVLACKENMALLLSAYCVVFLILEWRKGRRDSGMSFQPMSHRQDADATSRFCWYGAPLIVAIFWFILCTKVITPAFNSGNIDYLALYDRLGWNGPDIVRNFFVKPQLALGALAQSLGHGNLICALLLPFLALPLLRPRWLLVAAPVLLQHLLSWRSSEWNIYFHYGAPLLPLFWVATVEALDWLKRRLTVPPFRIQLLACATIIGCLIGQFWIGPAAIVESELLDQTARRADRERKQACLDKIPSDASVVAPLPYLSHLAMREQVYSLHYILKGLKTLSRERYQPPSPPDLVFIDYNDTATFDAGAGYYHPQLRGKDGSVVPSSDQLLHEFLRQDRWEIDSENELTLLRRQTGEARQEVIVKNGPPAFSIGQHTTLWQPSLTNNQVSAEQPGKLQFDWALTENRSVFPWMILRLTGNGRPVSITKGLCALQSGAGFFSEEWQFTPPRSLPPGEYAAEAVFVDNCSNSWSDARRNGNGIALLAPPVPLGTIKVEPPSKK